jgi:CheY-like chemotaxis protein
VPEADLNRLRLLLVEPDRTEGERLAVELGARGVAVERCSDAPSSLRRLRESGADAVALATPLADVDWIAAAAAFKEGPAAPALLLLDGTRQGAELARMLPAERAPDAVLPKPVSAAKLLIALVEVLQWRDAQSELPPGPTFPELLVALRDRGQSGVLELRADGLCTRITLRGGVPVFAEGGALRETLGRMLLRRGAIDEADYLRVIDRMTERLIENEATRMGEVMVELGLLTPREVFEALSAQVLEKITGCFRWLRLAHHFEPQDALPEDVAAFPNLSVEALVLGGVRGHFGRDRLEPLLAPHAARYPWLRLPPADLAERFQMTPAEQRVLPAIRGDRTLEAVRAASPLDSVQTAQVLAALSIGQALAWSEAPNARPRRAAQTRAKLAPAAPRRAAPPPKAEAVVRARPPLAASASSLTQLRNQLARSGRPPSQQQRAADPRTARLEAERVFRQGMRLLEQPAVPGALRAFARACELVGDEPEYRMFEAWAEYLTAKGDEALALARAKAAACAQRMLERDRDSVRAHAMLGQLCCGSGDLEAAERHFVAALRLAPDDREAQRGLRQVQRRRREAR